MGIEISQEEYMEYARLKAEAQAREVIEKSVDDEKNQKSWWYKMG